MIEILCPVCGNTLVHQGGSMKCENGHSYDISRKGYVNLLPPSGSGRHGDDKLMVKARTRFLDGGYYDRLSEKISSVTLEYLPQGGLLIDAGCGEGKYTCKISEALTSSGIAADIIGIDISKDAVNALASRNRFITAIVASTSSIPVKSGSADLVLNIFSPLFADEFRRVLKPEGVLIRVVPNKDHLWELKQLVYDTPYKNPPAETDLEGFKLIESIDLKYRITLPDSETVKDLFMMTPYYYKTGKEDQNKLENAKSLSVGLEFVVCVYRPSEKQW